MTDAEARDALKLAMEIWETHTAEEQNSMTEREAARFDRIMSGELTAQEALQERARDFDAFFRRPALGEPR